MAFVSESMPEKEPQEVYQNLGAPAYLADPENEALASLLARKGRGFAALPQGLPILADTCKSVI